MSEFQRKMWIGDKQIDSADEMPDRKDLNGLPLIRVQYIQGGVEYFTQKNLKGIITPKSTDATDLMTRRTYLIVQSILSVFSEYGFKRRDFEFLVMTLKGTIDQRLQQASDFLWGVDDQNLSFIDLVEVLTRREEALKDANKPNT